MKLNDFRDIKALDTKSLLGKVKTLRGELSELVLDKNMNKLKDVKSISKKRRDIAQILTVVKQKQLLEAFEGVDGEKDEKRKEKNKNF